MISKLRSMLPAIHHNRQGDVPVSTLLIIGVVVLPLVFLLIGFRTQLSDFLNTRAADALAEDDLVEMEDPFN